MSEQKEQMIALRKLSKHFDYNRAELAKALHVQNHVVYAWFTRGKISKQGAIQAEKATCGAIKKQELRPDIAEFEE